MFVAVKNSGGMTMNKPYHRCRCLSYLTNRAALRDGGHPEIAHDFVAVGTGGCTLLMIPAAPVADGAGDQRRFGSSVYAIDNLVHQPAACAFARPVAAAGFDAVAGEPKPLFGCPPLPRRFHKRFIDDNRLVKILDMTRCVLNTEEFSTGLGN